MNSPIPSPLKEMFAFGPFRLDTLGHTLRKDAKTIPLPPKAFELLGAGCAQYAEQQDEIDAPREHADKHE